MAALKEDCQRGTRPPLPVGAETLFRSITGAVLAIQNARISVVPAIARPKHATSAVASGWYANRSNFRGPRGCGMPAGREATFRRAEERARLRADHPRPEKIT